MSAASFASRTPARTAAMPAQTAGNVADVGRQPIRWRRVKARPITWPIPTKTSAISTKNTAGEKLDGHDERGHVAGARYSVPEVQPAEASPWPPTSTNTCPVVGCTRPGCRRPARPGHKETAGRQQGPSRGRLVAARLPTDIPRNVAQQHDVREKMSGTPRWLPNQRMQASSKKQHQGSWPEKRLWSFRVMAHWNSSSARERNRTSENPSAVVQKKLPQDRPAIASSISQ